MEKVKPNYELVSAATEAMYQLALRAGPEIDRESIALMDLTSKDHAIDIKTIARLTRFGRLLNNYMKESDRIIGMMESRLDRRDSEYLSGAVRDAERKAAAYLAAIPPEAAAYNSLPQLLENCSTMTSSEKKLYIAWITDIEVRMALTDLIDTMRAFGSAHLAVFLERIEAPNIDIKLRGGLRRGVERQF